MANDWNAENASELAGDQVKLVTYTIISLAPGAERILPQAIGDVLVRESMSECDFKSWIIAFYLESQGYKSYIESHPDEAVTSGEKKYLRVYYSVLETWDKLPLKFEEKQLRRLAGIEIAVRRLGHTGPFPAIGDGGEETD